MEVEVERGDVEVADGAVAAKDVGRAHDLFGTAEVQIERDAVADQVAYVLLREFGEACRAHEAACERGASWDGDATEVADVLARGHAQDAVPRIRSGRVGRVDVPEDVWKAHGASARRCAQVACSSALL